MRAATLTLFCLAALAGCQRSDPSWGDGPTPRVAVSFAPIYCFAQNVAGPDATVKPILTNQGPHHFDPKVSDAKLLAGANLFVINGLGLEDRAAEKMVKAAGNKGLQLVKLGDKLDEKLLLEGGHEGHDHGHDHGHAHDHDGHHHDPHVWLGLDQSVEMVNGLRDALKAAAPAKAAEYDRRAAEYVAKLEQLKADGVAMLKDKTERKFVTFHESLGYFANTFGLEVADVIEKTPGREPTAKQLDALVKTCLEKKVRVIAVEPQYTAQSIAARLKEELELKGVKDVVLVEIDPLETANEADLKPDWYETRMRANLKALADALK